MCWSSQSVPSQWKVGVRELLGKKSAEAQPEVPSNFRPIALTSYIGKVYTAILKQRWSHNVTINKYMNITIQKAFIAGISRCTEHHIKLLFMIEEARKTRVLDSVLALSLIHI